MTLPQAIEHEFRAAEIRTGHTVALALARTRIFELLTTPPAELEERLAEVYQRLG